MVEENSADFREDPQEDQIEFLEDLPGTKGLAYSIGERLDRLVCKMIEL